MHTYVINTSENKVLDSDLLFELVGYDRISWMHCHLNEIDDCAKDIFIKQNVLTADDYRVVVLVDFFGFELVRLPYDKDESKVETGIYRPCIEVYLHEHLFDFLAKKNLPADKCVIYYIQNGKYEKLDHIANAEEQTARIFRMTAEAEALHAAAVAERVPTAVPEFSALSEAEMAAIEQRRASRENATVPAARYDSFQMQCAGGIFLEFKAADYCYAENVTFHEFYNAILARRATETHVSIHNYATKGEGSARAAYDTLNLSLYLIRMYECGAPEPEGDNIEIARIERGALHEILATALDKVRAAGEMALESNCEYYQLYIPSSKRQTSDEIDGDALPLLTAEERRVAQTVPFEDAYRVVCEHSDGKRGEMSEAARATFDGIMDEYLERRDASRAQNIDAEFERKRKDGQLLTTHSFPSKHDYHNAVETKEQELQTLLASALDAEYVEVDYTEERTRADDAYDRYKDAEACMTRNILGDVIFLVITLLAMIIPYAVLQYPSEPFSVGALIMYGIAAGIFVGIFAFSFFAHFLPVLRRKKAAKLAMQEAYIDVLRKNKKAFAKLQRRYHSELIRIEEIRYELREIAHLYQINCKKNENARSHRKMLEDVGDRLAGMLSNLGVHFRSNPDITVWDEFDLEKPFSAPENKVYKIFSIEAIERMFPRKDEE